MIDPIARNHVKVIGKNKPPMLFSHGFGCDQSVFDAVKSAFGDAYQLISYDLVGAGHSDKSCYTRQRYDTLQGYADDLLEICHALNLRDITFVGHSVSCSIGCLAAKQEPKLFANLVLMAPSPCFLNDGDYKGGFERQQIEGFLQAIRMDYAGWAAQVAPVFMNNPDRRALSDDLCERFCRVAPEIASHFAQVTFLSDCRSALPHVTTPSLILQCTDDAVAPLSVGSYMQQQMPRSELKVLQAKGHFPHMSAPSETIDAMTDYLRRRARAQNQKQKHA